MNILILGGGGREHALAWAFAQNPKADLVFCAPGNAGIAEQATCVALDILDGDKILAFCAENAVGFVMVGPEAPLAEGVADALRAGGMPTLGPGREAARLEASKAFTKEICAARDVPTAASQTFTDPEAAAAYVAATGAPIVVKADGLAAGKGVTVAMTLPEAKAALDAIFAEGPGARVVIEEFMTGEEASLFILADGEELLVLGTAQDHKRAFDGDAGPNTGGMGAYSPAPILTPEVIERALAEIVRPTLAEMVAILVRLAAGLPRGELTAAQLRDQLDNGRKVAIQILEFFDRHGVTLRRGDLRRVNGHRLDLFGVTADGGESSPVGRPDFKSGWGREPAPGGFDSHSLPPIAGPAPRPGKHA